MSCPVQIVSCLCVILQWMTNNQPYGYWWLVVQVWNMLYPGYRDAKTCISHLNLCLLYFALGSTRTELTYTRLFYLLIGTVLCSKRIGAVTHVLALYSSTYDLKWYNDWGSGFNLKVFSAILGEPFRNYSTCYT